MPCSSRRPRPPRDAVAMLQPMRRAAIRESYLLSDVVTLCLIVASLVHRSACHAAPPFGVAARTAAGPEPLTSSAAPQPVTAAALTASPKGGAARGVEPTRPEANMILRPVKRAAGGGQNRYRRTLEQSDVFTRGRFARHWSHSVAHRAAMAPTDVIKPYEKLPRATHGDDRPVRMTRAAGQRAAGLC